MPGVARMPRSRADLRSRTSVQDAVLMDFSGSRDWSMPASTGARERRRDQRTRAACRMLGRIEASMAAAGGERTRGGWERRVVPEEPLAWSVFSRTGR